MKTTQINYQDVLRQELQERTGRNPKYGLRTFARHLQVSPALLSLVLNGKRSLTVKSASKILQGLEWSSEKKKTFLASVLNEKHNFKDARLKDQIIKATEDLMNLQGNSKSLEECFVKSETAGRVQIEHKGISLKLRAEQVELAMKLMSDFAARLERVFGAEEAEANTQVKLAFSTEAKDLEGRPSHQLLS